MNDKDQRFLEAMERRRELLGDHAVRPYEWTSSESVLREVFAAQAIMLEAAAEADLLDTQLEYLRGLTRLCVEFFHFLRDHLDTIDASGPSYVMGSIFSGIDSFDLAASAFRGLGGPRTSTLDWDVVRSVPLLKEQYLSKHREFTTEADFVKKFRLLLDLFKLQIVFAGVLHE